MLEQINNVMGRILISGEETSWDYGFLESITSQLAKGYTLSPKQERFFQQIQGRWSDEAMKPEHLGLKIGMTKRKKSSSSPFAITTELDITPTSWVSILFTRVTT